MTRKKRELAQDEPNDAVSKGAKKKLKTSKHVARPVKKKEKKPAKGLLDLPAELRNRIYHFAREADFGDHDNTDSTQMWMNPAPLIAKYASFENGKPQWPMSVLDYEKSGRKFFGLTQVCRQIRDEYRPIWLSNSSIRIGEYWPLSCYLHQFYGSCHPSENIPKLIQITYDDDLDRVVDITHLLRLHASHPATKIEFVPGFLVGPDGPWNHMECEWCLEKMLEGDLLVTEPPHEGCPHSYENRRDYGMTFLEQEQPCIGALNNLLAHDDPKWLQDLRSRDVARVKVDGTNDFGYGSPELIIRLAHNADIVKSKIQNGSIGKVVGDYIKTRNLKDTNTEFGSLHYELLICGTCPE